MDFTTSDLRVQSKSKVHSLLSGISLRDFSNIPPRIFLFIYQLSNADNINHNYYEFSFETINAEEMQGKRDVLHNLTLARIVCH